MSILFFVCGYSVLFYYIHFTILYFIFCVMDRKSQKLTNILLFIIVCFFVLGALLGLGRTAMMHRGFDRNVGGC